MSRSSQPHRLVCATGVALSVVVLLTGCGAATSPGSDPGTTTAGPDVANADVAGRGPWNLVGSWRLDSEGEATGTVLRLADGELSLWRGCDVLGGSWRADENGLFVGYTFAGLESCDQLPTDTPQWLAAAVGFVITDEGASLLDARGDVVARLRAGGRPTAGPNITASMAEPPKLTERIRRTFQPAEPLPAGLAVATADSLVGGWLPVEDGAAARRPEQARLDLHADGSWTASDGCNGSAGRWVSGPGGAVLAVSGFSTLIGCHNVNIMGWLSDAARAGFDGEVLVLLDRDGHETGRLRRG